MNFTEKLEELDKILKRVESPKTNLEDALADFEKGIGLIRECREYLETAKQKVTQLEG